MQTIGRDHHVFSYSSEHEPVAKIAPGESIIVGWLVLGVIYLFWRESRRETIDLDYAFRDAETSPSATTEPRPT